MTKRSPVAFVVRSVLLIAVGFCLSACATTRQEGAYKTQVEKEALVTVTAINVPDRLVTVRDAAGDSIVFYVDKSVEGFPQAKVGDRVRVRFKESFAVELMKPGESTKGVQVSGETSRSQVGQPSRHAAAEVKATVRIEKVERRGSIVTFTGPRGRRTVQILEPEMRKYVKNLKEGDNVEVTYSEALAISIERVAGS